MPQALLSIAHLHKSFSGIHALRDCSLQLFAGQVTALVGENGAGKSTLVKILSGYYQPDGGSMELASQALHLASPQQARIRGISVIHQEPVVFDNLSVAENIFIANHPRRHGRIDWAVMNQRAAHLLAQIGVDIDPGHLMRELGVAHRHLVQIARALACEAQIVIMDEPSAALSHHEAEELLRIVGELRDTGKAVLFISHKFDEVFAIADRFAVLRDGSTVADGQLRDTSLDELLTLMVGRPPGQAFHRPPCEPRAEILRVESLGDDSCFLDVSLDVRGGEILGIYGLVGSGRSELMQAIFGLGRNTQGRILIDGLEVTITEPADAIRHGIAYVPEDRQSQGAIMSQDIRSNIALPSLSRYASLGFDNRAAEHAATKGWIERMRVRATGPAQIMESLSGGNQQKVVLAKWLETQPRVLILDEPTKGIDVGAKDEIHQRIGELVAQGMAVILVSSELPEVLRMSDRIAVMKRGRLRGVFDRSAACPESIIRAATDS
jgi:rhamnose transport system ATP-binding protein